MISYGFCFEYFIIKHTLQTKKNLDDEELDENSVVINFAATALMEKIIIVKIYNIDVIISLGYSVNSKQDTHFCIWATKVLKDYNNA